MSDIVMRGSTRHTVESYVKYPRLDVTSNPYRKKTQSTNPTLPPRRDRTGQKYRAQELATASAIAAERKYSVSKIVQYRSWYRFHKP